MKKLSRRELGLLAAGVAAGAKVSLEAQTTGAAYIGPLTGVDSGIDDRGFDPVAFARGLYDAAPRRLRFDADALNEAEIWQGALRARCKELLAAFPADRSPLRPVTLETRSFAKYRREKIVFDSRPGVSVLAYVLLPSNARTPAPTMICVPGHGRGVD